MGMRFHSSRNLNPISAIYLDVNSTIIPAYLTNFKKRCKKTGINQCRLLKLEVVSISLQNIKLNNYEYRINSNITG